MSSNVENSFLDFLGKSSKNNNKFNDIISAKEGFSKTIVDFIYSKPTSLLIYSSIELALMILWLRNPWPLDENTFTKYPGSTRFFVILYVTITILYYLFLNAKKGFNEGENVILWNLTNLPFIIFDGNGKYPFSAKIYAFIGLILAFTLGFYGILWFLYTSQTGLTVAKLFLDIFLLSTLGGIVYLISDFLSNGKISKKTPGILGTIKDIILFIPCLIVILIEYISNQFKITTKPVWILLGIEILLISLKLLLPYILNKAVNFNGTQLLTEPVFLNNKNKISTLSQLYGKNNPSPNKYEYSISAWYYINPQPTSTSSAYSKYTPILRYGDKPVVEYNGSKNSIRVMCNSGENSLVKIAEINNIKYQKWNQIVINYDGANMDIFINGILVGSHPNIAPYMRFDDVITGDDNGIHGGICNVVYNNKIRSKGNINLSYNTLKSKNPPVL
tara:strand:+ start:968 stop:2305 length:1338 start_codon:yes stop_codon:yes gene_type:complete